MKLLLVLFIFCVLSCNQKSQKFNFNNIENDTINLGSVDYSSPVVSNYFLKNNSEKSIKILSVEAGCGCTFAQIKDSIILPQDSSLIIISYNPAVSNDSGEVAKYLTVRTDATMPFTNIVIRGDVNK